MKFLHCFYLGFFFFAFTAKAASSSMLDRKLLVPTTMCPSDSIVKNKSQSEVKTLVLGAISFSSVIVAIILAFVGATVGAIALGGIAILTGWVGEIVARKLTKEKLKSSSISPSQKAKTMVATLGVVLGALVIVVTLFIAVTNSILSVFKLGG